jgi:hypothetical protein
MEKRNYMVVKREFVALAEKFNTAPMYIADLLGFSPYLCGQLLAKRGEYREGESLEDTIMRLYGKDMVEECRSLIGVCPLEPLKDNGEDKR